MKSLLIFLALFPAVSFAQTGFVYRDDEAKSDISVTGQSGTMDLKTKTFQTAGNVRLELRSQGLVITCQKVDGKYINLPNKTTRVTDLTLSGAVTFTKTAPGESTVLKSEQINFQDPGGDQIKLTFPKSLTLVAKQGSDNMNVSAQSGRASIAKDVKNGDNALIALNLVGAVNIDGLSSKEGDFKSAADKLELDSTSLKLTGNVTTSGKAIKGDFKGIERLTASLKNRTITGINLGGSSGFTFSGESGGKKFTATAEKADVVPNESFDLSGNVKIVGVGEGMALVAGKATGLYTNSALSSVNLSQNVQISIDREDQKATFSSAALKLEDYPDRKDATRFQRLFRIESPGPFTAKSTSSSKTGPVVTDFSSGSATVLLAQRATNSAIRTPIEEASLIGGIKFVVKQKDAEGNNVTYSAEAGRLMIAKETRTLADNLAFRQSGGENDGASLTRVQQGIIKVNPDQTVEEVSLASAKGETIRTIIIPKSKKRGGKR